MHKLHGATGMLKCKYSDPRLTQHPKNTLILTSVQQNPPKSFASFDNIGAFQAKVEYQSHQSMDMGLGISGLSMPHDTQQTAFGDHPYQSNNFSICGNGVYGGVEVADQQSSSAGLGGAGLDYFGLPLGNDNDSTAFVVTNISLPTPSRPVRATMVVSASLTNFHWKSLRGKHLFSFRSRSS